MNRTYTPIDLSKLPPPQLVEELDFEIIFQEMLAKLIELDPTFNALVESDPGYKILQVAAYREMGIRQTMNDKARSRMLAYATGADLDHVGADRQPPVVRLEGEDDIRFRARIAMAPEGWSTAGPRGAYAFHASSAHAEIKHALAASAGAGVVQVAVLSSVGNGQCFGARINHPAGYADGATEIAVEPLKSAFPSGATLDFEAGAAFVADADFAIGETALTGLLTDAVAHAERGGILPFVEDALSDEDIRPLNDMLRVVSASILNYTVDAELTLYDGPDSEVVRQSADDAVAAYTLAQHLIGRDITLSGLLAALHQPGVQEVNLISPAARIEVDVHEAAFCTNISVVVVGRDE